MIVGYVVQAALRGITLEDCRIETEGKLDLRGFLGLDDRIPPGCRRINYIVHLEGDGTREQYRGDPPGVMATSPNYFNVAQPDPDVRPPRLTSRSPSLPCCPPIRETAAPACPCAGAAFLRSPGSGFGRLLPDPADRTAAFDARGHLRVTAVTDRAAAIDAGDQAGRGACARIVPPPSIAGRDLAGARSQLMSISPPPWIADREIVARPGTRPRPGFRRRPRRRRRRSPA